MTGQKLRAERNFTKRWLYFGAVLGSSAVLWAGCAKNSGGSAGSNGVVPYPNPQGGGVPLNANKNFAFLQKQYSSAVANPVPWVGYWWPYGTNGIVNSATKYDAADPNAPGGAASWEYAHHGLGLSKILEWWGHCNGWAAAAVVVPEPRASSSVGGVNFAIHDKKALLSEAFMEVTGDFLGRRVDNPDDTSSAAFLDVVPAQFFLMITNTMGIQRRTFVFDRYTGYQVWNQPAVAYFNEPVTPSDYLGPDPRQPSVYRVNVTTTIFWSSDDVDPDTLTPEFDPNNPDPAFGSRMLRYELWLDGPVEFDASGDLASSGDIILTQNGDYAVGGAWKNGNLNLVNSYPDYMWIPTGPSSSTGFKNPQIADQWVLSNMR